MRTSTTARLLLAIPLILAPLACSKDEETPPADDAEVADTGGGDNDAGPRPDGGGNPDAGQPDTGELDAGPLPDVGPQAVSVSGQVIKLGEYLAGNVTGSGGVSMLALGVAPVQSTVTSTAPAGAYTLALPANGQVVTFANKAGYFPSYNKITTQEVPITNKNLYLAENAWLNEIATAHNVNLAAPAPCHAPPQGNLDPGINCIYAIVVGRILDDGTAGAGTVRPVGGVAKADFKITGGPNGGTWYTKGPYFLNYAGTSSAAATASIVYNDNGTYKGGLYVFFAEVPQLVGPEGTDLSISIDYLYQGTTHRYFGPTEVKVYRPYGVSWTNVPETGLAPPPVLTNIDFDNQVYPLLLPVAQGGLGCQGCHTNQAGPPAAGMNLYGGPETAYNSLNPAQYPQRVNLATPANSLVLTKPLYEATGLQDHPIVAFASTADPAYQIIHTWITEGAVRNVVVVPVSFANEVRPLLYNQTDNGGAGCITCHGVQPPPGGFYMGGDAAALYDAITNQTPGDNGATGEPYRINKQNYPERSLLLINPLTGNIEPHPVKLFAGNADPRYQLLYRWIAEGYQNN